MVHTTWAAGGPGPGHRTAHPPVHCRPYLLGVHLPCACAPPARACAVGRRCTSGLPCLCPCSCCSCPLAQPSVHARTTTAHHHAHHAASTRASAPQVRVARMCAAAPLVGTRPLRPLYAHLRRSTPLGRLHYGWAPRNGLPCKCALCGHLAHARA